MGGICSRQIIVRPEKRLRGSISGRAAFQLEIWWRVLTYLLVVVKKGLAKSILQHNFPLQDFLKNMTKQDRKKEQSTQSLLSDMDICMMLKMVLYTDQTNNFDPGVFIGEIFERYVIQMQDGDHHNSISTKFKNLFKSYSNVHVLEVNEDEMATLEIAHLSVDFKSEKNSFCKASVIQYFESWQWQVKYCNGEPTKLEISEKLIEVIKVLDIGKSCFYLFFEVTSSQVPEKHKD